MKLGISSYTYTWSVGVLGGMPERPMTAPELITQAARLGVSVLQIADNLPLDRFSSAELDAIRESARQNQVSIEVGTRGIDLAHLRRYLDLAVFFGSPILRVVVDTAEHRPGPEEVISTLSALRGEFQGSGIRLAIENHDRFPCRVLASIVRSLGEDWAGICLDTVNSLGALEGPQVVVGELCPLALNLHVKDFEIFRPGHKMGFIVEGRPAGQGRLDIPWLLAEFQRNGRDCSAILELWTPPEASLEETIIKERRWAKESIQYLRRWIPE